MTIIPAMSEPIDHVAEAHDALMTAIGKLVPPGTAIGNEAAASIEQAIHDYAEEIKIDALPDEPEPDAKKMTEATMGVFTALEGLTEKERGRVLAAADAISFEPRKPFADRLTEVLQPMLPSLIAMAAKAVEGSPPPRDSVYTSPPFRHGDCFGCGRAAVVTPYGGLSPYGAGGETPAQAQPCLGCGQPTGLSPALGLPICSACQARTGTVESPAAVIERSLDGSYHYRGNLVPADLVARIVADEQKAAQLNDR